MTLPSWVKTQLREIKKTQNYFKNRKLNTVCETLRCPNRSICYQEPTATFMIMGNICTRGCRFCNAEKGNPEPLDNSEPERVAKAVQEMSLKYVVVTSPTRDDLSDGGAEHFSETVKEIKKYNPQTLVEVLVPDFRGKRNSVETVVNSEISVFAHNIETIKKFYGNIRKADFDRSIDILLLAKEINPKIIVKSGFMLGLGETLKEVYETLEKLKKVKCDIVTIGQYLQPSKKALPVVEYIKPEIFDRIAEAAMDMGFKAVLSGPLVRSSTRAYEIYSAVREGRYGKF